jgi:hypothetical protein
VPTGWTPVSNLKTGHLNPRWHPDATEDAFVNPVLFKEK